MKGQVFRERICVKDLTRIIMELCLFHDFLHQILFLFLFFKHKLVNDLFKVEKFKQKTKQNSTNSIF